MSHTSKTVWLSGLAFFAVVIIAFAAVFALQPSHHTTPLTTISPTPTPTITPTMTATPEPTLTAQQFVDCFNFDPQNMNDYPMVRVGDIVFLDYVGPLTYPTRALPNGVSSPYKLTGVPTTTGNASTDFASSFVGDADPFGAPDAQHPYTSKFLLEICNLSTSATYHVSEIGTVINQLTPYTGELNVWVPPPCSTSYYASATHQVTEIGGCGGSIGPHDIDATVIFPNDSKTGTAATGMITGSSNIMIPPTKTNTALVSITLPAIPGTYLLAPTLKIDNGLPIEGTPGDPYIYAPVAHVWDGKACANMSIPTSPPAYYICE